MVTFKLRLKGVCVCVCMGVWVLLTNVSLRAEAVSRDTWRVQAPREPCGSHGALWILERPPQRAKRIMPDLVATMRIKHSEKHWNGFRP